MQHLLATFGKDFEAVRLGWGYYGELNLPDRKFNGKENCYWAYDDIAQGKQPGLPTGMAACPVPGWKPGDASADHESAQVRELVHGLPQELPRLADRDGAEALSRPLAMMYPSWGIRPGQLDAAIEHDLDGGDPGREEWRDAARL